MHLNLSWHLQIDPQKLLESVELRGHGGMVTVNQPLSKQILEHHFALFSGSVLVEGMISIGIAFLF